MKNRLTARKIDKIGVEINFAYYEMTQILTFAVTKIIGGIDNISKMLKTNKPKKSEANNCQ